MDLSLFNLANSTQLIIKIPHHMKPKK